MVEPRRLLQDDVSPFEQELLRSASRDAPSTRSRGRILAELGVGGALALFTSQAGARSAGWLREALRLPGLHWGVGGVLGVAGFVGAYVASSTAKPPPTPERPLSAEVAPRPALSPTPSAAISVPALAEEAPETRVEPVTPGPASKRSPVVGRERGGALSDELGALEAARSALSAGSAKRALGLLDDYQQRFKNPHLLAEATVLRIEALVQSGDRARARKLGNQLLAQHPNGPYERRVRSLIAQSTPAE